MTRPSAPVTPGTTRPTAPTLPGTIRAVLLDVDNTLLDFDGYVKQALHDGFAAFGIGAYEEWMYDRFENINDELWRRIERGTLTFSELQKIRFNLVFGDLGVTGDGPAFETFFREQLNESAIEIPGAKDMLARLHGKYILCAVSNGPHFQQVHRLELAGMAKYFDYIYISERVGAQKPDRAFFDYCLADMHRAPLKRTLPSRAVADPTVRPLRPEEICILGDSLTSDMAGGREMGFYCCFYDRRGTHDQLPSCADAMIHHLSEWVVEGRVTVTH